MSETINIPWKGWEIVRRLGSGSFGTVYEIRREMYGVSEKAALKVIPVPKNMDTLYDLYGSTLDSAGIENWCQKKISTITQEYAVMLELKDAPNIVRCDDMEVVRKEGEEGYNIFIRMELLEPLHKITRSKELSEQDVIKLAGDICNAISVCEARGIIHRDIKPENILVNSKGDYKLGDFGTAREMDHTTAATRTGTPPYMAPEMALGKKYGHTVDIYALGILMYRFLNNNKLPFWPADRIPEPNEIANAFTRRISGEQIKEPLKGSPELKRIVLKACAFDPADRYQSAKEMLADIGKLTGEHGVYKAAVTDIDDEMTVAETAAEVSGKTAAKIPNTGEDDSTVAMFGTSGKAAAKPVKAAGKAAAPAKAPSKAPVHKYSYGRNTPPPQKAPVTQNKKLLAAILILVMLIAGGTAFALLGKPSDEKVTAAFADYVIELVDQSSYIDEDGRPVIGNVEHTYNSIQKTYTSDMTLLSCCVEDFDGDGQLEMMLSRKYSAEDMASFTLTLFEYSNGKITDADERDADYFDFDDGVPSGDFYPTGVVIHKDEYGELYVLPFSDRYNKLYSKLPADAYVRYYEVPENSENHRYIRQYGFDESSSESFSATVFEAEMEQLKTSEDGQLTEPLDAEFIQIK